VGQRRGLSVTEAVAREATASLGPGQREQSSCAGSRLTLSSSVNGMPSGGPCPCDVNSGLLVRLTDPQGSKGSSRSFSPLQSWLLPVPLSQPLEEERQ
jgi:hypothetical protein